MSESAKLPGQVEPGLAPAEEAFLRYVRRGALPPQPRTAFYAGWLAGADYVDSSLSKNETIDTQLSKEHDD